MIYSHPEFFMLFTVCLTLTLLCPWYTLRLWILLLTSLFFYAWAGTLDTLLFLLVVLVSWLAIFFANKYPRHRRAFLFLGVLAMTFHLLFWKYGSWIVGQIQVLFPDFLGGKQLELPLPVGISFFTLQGIAYLVDFGRDEAQFIPLREYFLFKSFFAQLVAGPIVRAKQLVPQLLKLPRPTSEDLLMGFSSIGLGFFKKVAIADRIGPFVDSVFAEPQVFSRGVLFQALLGYSVQIWADFSGYVDMGRGAARCLGIHLPENFLSPYLAQSPSEFWRRWHITLSEWVRDYIYIPLGGNNGSRLKSTLVLLLTFGISGLWHGAAWTFILWGFYHGTLLALERMLQPSPQRETHTLQLQSLLRGCFMFFLTLIGWLIFRAQNMDRLLIFVRSFISNAPMKPIPDGGSEVILGLVITFLLQAVLYYDFQSQRYPVLDGIRKRSHGLIPRRAEFSIVYGLTYGIALSGLFALSLLLRNSDTSNAFIYFKF